MKVNPKNKQNLSNNMTQMKLFLAKIIKTLFKNLKHVLFHF